MISIEEMRKEENKLSETNEWIDNQIEGLNSQYENLENKLHNLKIQSRGTYSTEYEINNKIYTNAKNKLNNYKEASYRPYFSRVDFIDKIYGNEILYIGKFGLADIEKNEEVVIDWRAPIADLYYSGTKGKVEYKSPNGIVEGELSLKRKFLIKDGILENAFDEGINEIILKSEKDNADNELIDEFLKINLEESASGKLKDVVATIQKEQNDIIRAEKNSTLVIQGSAGSGKTTVALHRLAYLLYRFKDKLHPEKILVIAPNKIFLNYISEVLPSLGVDNIKQLTYEELASNILEIKDKIYYKDSKLSIIIEQGVEKSKFIETSSKFKGSMVFRKILDRYLMFLEKNDSCLEDIKVDDIKIFERNEINRLYHKDLSHLPIKKRKLEIKRYYLEKLKEKIPYIHASIDFKYNILIKQIKEQINDTAFRQKKILQIYEERDLLKKKIKQKSKKTLNDFFNSWGKVDIKKTYIDLFKDEKLFSEITDNKLPSSLYKYMSTLIKEDQKNKIIDSDDLTGMLYLKLKLDGIEEGFSFNTIVVDEAQDYSLFQISILKDITSNDSLTIVGDIGQGIYSYKGINDWNEMGQKIFGGQIKYIPLTQSYRSTVEIINFANRVLDKQGLPYKPAKPVLRHGINPEVREFKNDIDFAYEVNEIVNKVTTVGKKTIAIIGKTMEECKKIYKIIKKSDDNNWKLVSNTQKEGIIDKIIIPSYMTKGLEFDCTIIYNCNKENYKINDLDKKILYVCLTRALHMEYVFYKGSITELLC